MNYNSLGYLIKIMVSDTKRSLSDCIRPSNVPDQNFVHTTELYQIFKVLLFLPSKIRHVRRSFTNKVQLFTAVENETLTSSNNVQYSSQNASLRTKRQNPHATKLPSLAQKLQQ